MMLRKRKNRFIFIVGCPRSGTTLLYRLLTESGYFVYPKDQNGKFTEGTDIWWKALDAKRTNEVWKISNEEASKIHKTYSELGDGVVLDKNLFMGLWLFAVRHRFPEAKIIHITRDARAVVNSMLYKYRYSEKKKDLGLRKKRGWFGPQPTGNSYVVDRFSLAKRCLWLWTTMVSKCRNDGMLLFEDNYKEISYEDLTDNPREKVKELLEFCGCEVNEEMINKYPKKFENRNYKSRQDDFKSDEWTKRKAISSEDDRAIGKMLNEYRNK